MIRADDLAAALDDFIGVLPDVEGAAIVSADGLPIASALPDHVHEDRLAAMGAALLILGERAASGLGKGELSEIMVENSEGYIALMAAGPHAVLVAVTSRDAKAGLLLFEMRRLATAVADIMQQDATAQASADREQRRSDARRQPTASARSHDPSSVPTWR